MIFTQLLPRKQILTEPSRYGGWPVRGGCVNSKYSSSELCYISHKHHKQSVIILFLTAHSHSSCQRNSYIILLNVCDSD